MKQLPYMEISRNNNKKTKETPCMEMSRDSDQKKIV